MLQVNAVDQYDKILMQQVCLQPSIDLIYEVGASLALKKCLNFTAFENDPICRLFHDIIIY